MLKLKKEVIDKLTVFEFTQVDFRQIEEICLSEDKNCFVESVVVYLDFCEGVDTEFLITKDCFESDMDFGK